jgi:NAD(P)-dependent dehydrogenase (short-subunit alcohol dehydrogenase family)
MRLELHGTNIHLILVEPGPIRTRIRENAYIQFKQWINWKESARKSWYEEIAIPRLSAINPPPDTFELMPVAVTKAVIHAATAKRPKLRYRVTTATTLMMILRRLLSSRAYDALARRL